MSTFIYIRNFIKDKNIATIAPTSQFGVKKVCSKINFETANVIVEYGPGAGAFTKYLLKKMNPRAKLVVIERNRNFASFLKKKFHDKRLFVFHDSAEHILDILKKAGVDHVDYILSGIPFSFLPVPIRHRIVENTHCALKAGGKFLPYQMFYQPDRHLKKPLTAHFGNVEIEYEILSFPPIRIYEAVKRPVNVAEQLEVSDFDSFEREAVVL